jgi:hypothetical protein
MADNGRLRALANAAFRANPLEAGVKFIEGPIMPINVPRQEMNNNQGRRQPQLTQNQLKESLDELYAEYNSLKEKCVVESARLSIDPKRIDSASKDDCIKYRNDVNNLIIVESRCKEILQMIAGLNRIHGQPYNPMLKAEYDAFIRDINRNTALLDYVNSVISSYTNTSNSPMAGGKKKRKAKRKTKRRA